LKKLIVHSPEKIQIINEEIKAKNDSVSKFLEDTESSQKNLERHLKLHESLLKCLNEYETLTIDSENVTIKLKERNEFIYVLEEERNKKDKLLIEIKSKIENINKSLVNLSEYILEFHNKQKKALELKEDTFNSSKEKLQNYQKRLSELNDAIKLQLSNNKNIEENVNYFYILD